MSPSEPSDCEPRTPLTRIRRHSTLVLRLVVGTLIALTIAELSVRHIYFLPLAFDPVFGMVPKAGAAVRWCTEGCATSHWKARGTRDTGPFTPSGPRILFLGDSLVEAMQVEDREVFTYRLRRRLMHNAIDVEIVNAGRSGSTAADYLALATDYQRIFDPRWVVIELMDQDLAAEAWVAGRPDHARFVRDGAGSLATQRSPPQAPGDLWLALQPIRQASSLYTYGMLRFRELAAAAAREPRLFFGAESLPARPVEPKVESYAIDDVLMRLHQTYGGRVTFLYLAEFDPRAPMTSRSAIEQVFMGTCREKGWHCLNHRSAFRGFAAQHESPFGFANRGYNMGHLNEQGHRSVAKVLEPEIRQLANDDLL